ncbi:MAG: hypothetical protein IPK50_07105 [Fibrobacterota bacterium]|nr:MAG: hypothetical protein IPK50_07105 [Fibrobacterota bacterium]
MLSHASDIAQRIRSGERLLLAAQEEVLLSLPAGNWIGGTIPYFMAETGGVVSREMVFATAVPIQSTSVEIRTYGTADIHNICKNAPDNGVTFLILPASSPIHLQFAQKAPDFEDMYLKPLLGWISGVHLDDLGRTSPKVVDGRTVTAHTDAGVAIHCALPENQVARMGIVNLFSPGDGAVLTFPEGGFQVERCLVDGVERVFSDYLLEREVDTRLPLVADCSGAMVNVSFQGIESSLGRVNLYAPVFPGVEYRLAKPVGDYMEEFAKMLPKNVSAAFSCNCILNFLYSGLEGKITEGMTGPVTFGEIACQLLNQTMVYVAIETV